MEKGKGEGGGEKERGNYIIFIDFNLILIMRHSNENQRVTVEKRNTIYQTIYSRK